MLLDNGTDPTSIPANAANFTMNTALAPGAAYNIDVGTQPYGIDLRCTVTDATGVAAANVAGV